MGRAPLDERTLLLLLYRSCGNLVEAYGQPLIRYPHGAVDPLFHRDLLGPYAVIDLVELLIMLDGVVVPDGTYCSYAEDGVKSEPLGAAVEVSFFLRWYGKAPVVPGKIGDEEAVCFLYGTDTLEPHLLYQPVLEGVKESFYPSFRRGRMCMDEPDAELG